MSRFAFVALFLIACIRLATAQGTYTQIDYPGATETYGNGIDAAGDVVGSYRTGATGTSLHGFLLSAGAYTSIDYAGAAQTVLTGINDAGQIVGYSEYPFRGFVYDTSTQTFTDLSFPPGTDIYPSGINNDGSIAGYVSRAPYEDTYTGFELAASGRDLQIVPPGSRAYTIVTGIDADGGVVGYFSTGYANYNFTFTNGIYRKLSIPGTTPSLYGVNPQGTVMVGTYSYSENKWMGFLFQNGVLKGLQPAGAEYTSAQGINSAGVVVGYFEDANLKDHGFTWTPDAATSQKK